jgi:hypothetical protein
VVLVGEQTVTEPALKERIIEVTFTKQQRKGRRHIQEFTRHEPGRARPGLHPLDPGPGG